MKLPRLSAAVATTLTLGLAAGGCGAAPQAAVLRTSQSHPAPSIPSPSCKTSPLNEFSQGLDGTIEGCYQVPAYAPGAYTLSLESLYSKLPAATLKGTGSRSSTNPLRLALSPASGPPGTKVTIHGSFASGSLPPGTPVDQQFTTVCWDGCASGLQDGAEPIKVGAGGGQAEATFTLHAPLPQRCVKGKSCAHLTVTPADAIPGQIVHLEGWAPVPNTQFPSLGYQIQLSKGHAPAASTVRVSLGPHVPGATVIASISLAPATLAIAEAPSWASLGTVKTLSSQTAGLSALPSSPGDSQRIAYCTDSGLQLSTDGGAHFEAVPTQGAIAALRQAGLTPATATSDIPPCCDEVVLGPSPSTTIYASFLANSDSDAPVSPVGLETTKQGSSWKLIPTPKGALPLGSGGLGSFDASSSEVIAEFSTPPTKSGTEVPVLEATDGGVTWAPTPFSCPHAGPCLRLEAFQWGNCAMNGEVQYLLSSTDQGTEWSFPSLHLRSVDVCDFSQLVAPSPTQELLLEPDSGYALQVSSDDGLTWSDIALPALSGTSTAPGSALTGGLNSPTPLLNQAGGSLQVLPSGALLLAPSTQGQPWELLVPDATSWCHPPATPGADPGFLASAPTVVGNQLWWVSTAAAPGAAKQAHHLSLSELQC